MIRNNKIKKKTVEQKNVSYCKLGYIGKFSLYTRKKINQLCKQFCKNTNIKLVFTPTKLSDYFSTKDALPKDLRSFVVYKFTCAGCNACYIGETKRHLKTRITEHLETDKSSHVHKHLNDNENCRRVCHKNCFEVIDSASSSFRLKVKEAIHITWSKPSLNKQVNHVSMTITV